MSVEENDVTTSLFSHNINCISIATIDIYYPTLYCYVVNLDAQQRERVKSDDQDRRLYLFECTDLLQTRKLIAETKKRFRNPCKARSPHRIPAGTDCEHHPEEISRMLEPQKCKITSCPTVPPRQNCPSTADFENNSHNQYIPNLEISPPPTPPRLPHYLNHN